MSELNGIEQRDVVVIGAGPAGSIAARQLALANFDVLLVERKVFPRRKVCGCCLNRRALVGLEAAGVIDAVTSLGAVPLDRFVLRAFGRRVELPMPSGLAVSRAAMDQALVEAAQAAGVEFLPAIVAHVGEIQAGCRVVSLKRNSDDASVAGRVETASIGSKTHEPHPVSIDRLVAAKVVLVADGLGHPSLKGLPEFASDRSALEVAQRSRLGAGCEVSELPDEFEGGSIAMLVGRAGYVGLTKLETGRWNLAAAFDPEIVRKHGGLAGAACSVSDDALGDELSCLKQAEWSGTPQLTRRPQRVAFERLFLLGDAAGYVEPFTGEGMAGAIESALAVGELATAAVSEWRSQLIAEWTARHRALLQRRAWLCRGLAELVRRPWCVRGSMAVISRWPTLARPLIRSLNEPTVWS